MRPVTIGRVAPLLLLLPVSAALAGLPRSEPEGQGVSSDAVLSFIETADEQLDSLHSFMLVRHGYVVSEGWWAPYHPEARHSLYSLSKSFTSTAIGIAITEGKLKLHDEVLKAFPEDAPAEASANLKSMRLFDLLRMSTGHQAEPPRPLDQSWTKAFLAQPVPFKPGTHFLYNTSATYMCSAMLQKATGETLLDYLRPRLFEPLEIMDPTWEVSPQGISTGGYGLNVRTEDIASFGQLYLQKGRWKGKQLVPEEWIEAATARQTSNGSDPKSDWDQGYGFQFWRCRHGAYRGDGAFGQYCIVLPDQDAVIAITSGLKDMQAVLNVVWDKLLPAFQPGKLAENASGRSRLEERLKGLSVRLVSGTGAKAEVFGKTFQFPENESKLESLILEHSREESSSGLLKIRIAGTDHRIELGRTRWRNGKTAWGRMPIQAVATCGAWAGDGLLRAKLCFYETPFTLTVTLKFSDNDVEVTTESNVGFGSTSGPVLIGKSN